MSAQLASIELRIRRGGVTPDALSFIEQLASDMLQLTRKAQELVVVETPAAA